MVRDQISGKVSDEDKVYFKVINQLPSMVDFVIRHDENQEEELVTPANVKLSVVQPKDSDGQIKKYRWWYFVEGNEDEKLGAHTTTVPETNMVITAQGQPDISNRYYFVVEMVDNDNGIYNSFERFGEVSYLDIKNGPNLSPVAEFTMDKTTVSAGDSITFISKSYDPQGDILPADSYYWDFDGDGEFDDMSSGDQVNRQFNTPGEYEVRLKVVHRGLSSSTSKMVYVEATQTLPQAAFTYQVDKTKVTFDATNTRYDKDLDDPTLRYEWDFNVEEDSNGNGIKDDDIDSTELKPSYTYPEIKTYRVKLKVKDSTGMEGIVVREVNLALSEEDREKNSYQSLSVSSPDQPLTALNVTVSPAVISTGGSADIEVTVLNADNSDYRGEIFFEMMEGSGNILPNPTTPPQSSKASAVFSAVDSGPVRIKVKATNTHFGDVEEEITIIVK